MFVLAFMATKAAVPPTAAVSNETADAANAGMPKAHWPKHTHKRKHARNNATAHAKHKHTTAQARHKHSTSTQRAQDQHERTTANDAHKHKHTRSTAQAHGRTLTSKWCVQRQACPPPPQCVCHARHWRESQQG